MVLAYRSNAAAAPRIEPIEHAAAVRAFVADRHDLEPRIAMHLRWAADYIDGQTSGVSVDLDTGQVTIDGVVRLRVPHKPAQVLAALAARRSVDREGLIEALWQQGADEPVKPYATLNMHISVLRRRLRAAAVPLRIDNHHSLCYKLERLPEA